MDLYYWPTSPSCRAVLMCAKAVGIKLRKIPLDITKKEHMQPWFLAINPQHIVPTIVDNGFVLWESRAIMTYLVEEYGINDNLYPVCDKLQGLINQSLYLDIESLNRREFYISIFIFDKKTCEEVRRLIDKGFRRLDIILMERNFIMGDFMTVADFALLATVSTYKVATYDFSKFKNVSRWYNAAPNVIPGWDENMAGCKELCKRLNLLKRINNRYFPAFKKSKINSTVLRKPVFKYFL